MKPAADRRCRILCDAGVGTGETARRAEIHPPQGSVAAAEEMRIRSNEQESDRYRWKSRALFLSFRRLVRRLGCLISQT